MATTIENYYGSSCSGTNGTTSRTLTLSNTATTNNNDFFVFVNNSFLHPTIDYTVSHASSSTVITFLNIVWDDQRITVKYGSSTTLSGSGYCSVDDVRLISKLTTSDISDADLEDIIAGVTKEINKKINIEVIREKIEYIDNTRENDINGVNTTYYVKNWKGKYLADRNYDGEVNTSDVIVYAVNTNGTETEATVSSITTDEGKIVLSTAYNSTYTLYITYCWSHWDEYTPHQFVTLAAMYLSAANAFLKKDTGVQSVRFGNVSIYKKLSGSYASFYNKYEAILRDLLSFSTLKDNWEESKVKI